MPKSLSTNFQKAGFFDADLNIVEPISKESFIMFAKESLQNGIVVTQLTPQIISEIQHYLETYDDYFPGDEQRHLVHADFDPANILVDQVEGKWKITGVLDWEFAFSGSVLCDVANMLRYAHQMPNIYEDEFLRGLKNSGVVLPVDWDISIKLLNLLSLLDCLKRADPKNRPNQCADICGLITYICQQLKQ